MNIKADFDAEIQCTLQFASCIPGQTWPNELGWLFNVMYPFSVHAEIGSYCGRSLYVTAGGMHLLGTGQHTILAIDPTGYTGDETWDGAVLRETIAKIHRDFPSVKVEHLEALSIDAFRDLKEDVRDELESVFIDGEHHFAEVSADIECWGRAASRLASGHDYWPNHWGVMDAVHSEFGDGSFTAVSGTRIWCVDKRAQSNAGEKIR